MYRASQKVENGFEKVNAFLVDKLLSMDSPDALSARAEYYASYVTNGLDLAKSVYVAELGKDRLDAPQVLLQFMQFLSKHSCKAELESCIER